MCLLFSPSWASVSCWHNFIWPELISKAWGWSGCHIRHPLDYQTWLGDLAGSGQISFLPHCSFGIPPEAVGLVEENGHLIQVVLDLRLRLCLTFPLAKQGSCVNECCPVLRPFAGWEGYRTVITWSQDRAVVINTCRLPRAQTLIMWPYREAAGVVNVKKRSSLFFFSAVVTLN